MLRTVTLPDGRELSYTLTRKAVRNINLRISPEGDLRASASKWVPAEQIDSFVLRSGPGLLARWQAARRRQTAHPAYPAPREGAVFWICGMPMTLHLERGAGNAALAADALVLTLPDPADGEAVRKAFRRWHRARCTALFGARSREIAARCGLPEADLTLRDMTARWGSCHTRSARITLNTRLLAAPPDCQEYVICHEYAHFYHPDHSPRFYEKLEQLLPDWRQRKEALRAFSPAGEPEEGEDHGI